MHVATSKQQNISVIVSKIPWYHRAKKTGLEVTCRGKGDSFLLLPLQQAMNLFTAKMALILICSGTDWGKLDGK
jgi:hypothetical protein